MNNIEEYLYHGLKYNIRNSIDTLEMILKSGYIMTRNSLREYLSEIDWLLFLKEHPPNWNEQDSVSIACHPNNIELIEKYNINLPYAKHDNAYYEYTNTKIILLLDPIILKKYNQKEKSLKMGYELQFIGNISISYIKAIGIRIPNNMINLNIYNEYIYWDYVSNILEILTKYNIDVPIIDFDYGNILTKTETIKKVKGMIK